MGPIKVRAKSIVDGTYVIGQLKVDRSWSKEQISRLFENYYVFGVEPGRCKSWAEVEKQTVEKSLGINDLLGKEAFEGDIIVFSDETTDQEPWICKIVWSGFAWKCVDLISGEEHYLEDMQNDNVIDGRIIGNVQGDLKPEERGDDK